MTGAETRLSSSIEPKGPLMNASMASEVGAEAVVAFPEGVVATFALGERTLPADPKATRRRMLFTAAGYGFLEGR